MKIPRITVIGNINMDANIRTPRFPSVGETLIGHDVSWSPGGKGANQAVAAANLGADVSIIGCVGLDAFGEELVANLEKRGVDCERVRRVADCATGTAFVMVRDDGQNLIVSCLGANLDVSPSEVEASRSVIKASDVVLLQLGIPLDAVEAVIDVCWATAAPCFLDLSPLRDVPPRNWRRAALVSPNETEAGVILGGCHGIAEGDATGLSRRLLGAGARRVALKLGAGGCIVADAGGLIRVRAPDVVVEDTTGAGDAFMAGLAVGFVEECDWQVAARMAVVAGSLACTRRGAQAALPTREEVRSCLAKLDVGC